MGDNCQFLFQQQSSLVRFLIMCIFFYFRFSDFSQQFSKYSFDAQKNNIFVTLVKFVVKFMLFLVRFRTSGFENFPEHSSGKFSILTKIWISFNLQLIDPKFHVDQEYLVYLVGSSMVEALSLTSGILPENLHKTSK